MRSFSTLLLCSLLFFACSNPKPAEEAGGTADADSTPAPVEFADAKYVAIGKQNLDAITRGDIALWMGNFSENAVYVWNGGDSLVGKPAISEFWTKRRADIIDSISYSNQIWLPVVVNQTQADEQAGVWLLGWYRVDAKYKSGKAMSQWMHVATHFDANDKIDRIVQYVDRLPIQAAEK
jgi:ketosteroid isomerase-like protein